MAEWKNQYAQLDDNGVVVATVKTNGTITTTQKILKVQNCSGLTLKKHDGKGKFIDVEELKG